MTDRESVIAEMRRCSVDGRVPTIRDHQDLYSRARRVFGRWTDAAYAAGLRLNNPHPPREPKPPEPLTRAECRHILAQAIGVCLGQGMAGRGNGERILAVMRGLR